MQQVVFLPQAAPGFPPAQQPSGMPSQMPSQLPAAVSGPVAPMQQHAPQGYGPVSVQPAVAQQRPAAQLQAPTSAASAANPAAPVADSWTEHTAPDGRKYYYNKATKQSSWEKPASLAAAPAVMTQLLLVICVPCIA